MYEFRLPDVGEGIHEAEIVRWLVEVGQPVELDQPMLDIQTDKALVEIPAPASGTVAEIQAQPGELVKVGELLIIIETTPETAKPESVTPQSASAAAGNGQSTRPVVGIAGPGQRVLAAPAIRRLAVEHQIDLSQLTGSGSNGRILLSDLQQAINEPPPRRTDFSPSPSRTLEQIFPHPASPSGKRSLTAPTTEPTETIPLQGLRRRIAERMTEAWQVPHVCSFEEVEVSQLVAWRAELKTIAEEQTIQLTYLPFIIKATVQALKQFPDFNATLDMTNQQIQRHYHYHIGVAMALPEGLVVPVIRQADQLSLLALAREISRLRELAQTRKLTRPEMSGSTFSITNFGSVGGYLGTPIINPPEAAILGCGRIEERVIPVDSQPAVRPVLPLALSFDHRLIDGVKAAQFLAHLKWLLTEPKRLFLEM